MFYCSLYLQYARGRIASFGVCMDSYNRTVCTDCDHHVWDILPHHQTPNPHGEKRTHPQEIYRNTPKRITKKEAIKPLCWINVAVWIILCLVVLVLLISPPFSNEAFWLAVLVFLGRVFPGLLVVWYPLTFPLVVDQQIHFLELLFLYRVSIFGALQSIIQHGLSVVSCSLHLVVGFLFVGD